MFISAEETEMLKKCPPWPFLLTNASRGCRGKLDEEEGASGCGRGQVSTRFGISVGQLVALSASASTGHSVVVLSSGQERCKINQ